MKRRLMIAACSMAPITVALLVAPRHSAACSYDATPFARMPHHAHLIVVPTDRLVSSARRLPPQFSDVRAPRGFDETIWQPGSRWWWEARVARWFRRLRDRPPYGQLARLEYVGGAGSTRTSQARGVVIVRWATDGMCRPALREERTPAFTPGERVFLTATLRDTTHWVSGLPTFDMSSEHFSHNEREQRERQTERAGRPMLARELLSAYEALPAYDLLGYQGSDTALAPLRAWAESHPTLVEKYPAYRMIANATQYARSADSVRLRIPPYRTRLPNVLR